MQLTNVHVVRYSLLISTDPGMIIQFPLIAQFQGFR